MLTSYQITEAFEETIRETNLAERVERWHIPDFLEAVESLRAAPDNIIFIIPLGDHWTHDINEETGEPLRSESRERVILLCSNRSLSMEGNDETLPVKDHLTARLLWDNLGQPNLLCLPQTSEPIDLNFDGSQRGRIGWKMEFEIRQKIFC